MRTDKNILIAFVLNFAFSFFELFGGIFTGSIAIISDAIHDIGDAVSIGVSYFWERKSKKQPDETYTYGYARYSVLGGAITTLILLLSSILVIYNAVGRIVSPTEINYNGMIIFAIVGVCVNLTAAIFTRDGHSLNQKAVNLHMLEDVLGWIVVLTGAIIMRFSDFSLIDPIMSIGVAIFIFWNACKNLQKVLDLFLIKTPDNISIPKVKEYLTRIDGVTDVHHIHIWSIDGFHVYATMHIVTNAEHKNIKKAVREELHEHGISHMTLELETENENCQDLYCKIVSPAAIGHHHHNHKH